VKLCEPVDRGRGLDLHSATIKRLVEAGAPVNVHDQVGDTPLDAGKTPLDLARKQGHENVADLLAAAGGLQGGDGL